MENKTLLPCPFCGWEKPEIFVDDKQLTVCVKCKCGSNSKVFPLDLVDSTKLSVDFWNMRANPFLISRRHEFED